MKKLSIAFISSIQEEPFVEVTRSMKFYQTI